MTQRPTITTLKRIYFLISLVFLCSLRVSISDAEPIVEPPLKNIVPGAYVLVIGLDNYSETELGNLQYSKIDAKRVQVALLGLQPRVRIIETKLLLDQDATKDRILGDAQAMASKLGEGEMLIIYFTGHSTASLQHDVYLAPFDATLRTQQDFVRSAISIKNDLAPIAREYRHVLLIADGCHIGDGQLGDVALKYPGFAVLSAARVDEVDYEDKRWEGSPFTEALVESLHDNIPDYYGEGLISVDALYIYLYQKMATLVRHGRFVTHPALFGSLTHKMRLAQAFDMTPELRFDGSFGELGDGRSHIKVNGYSSSVNIDLSRSELTVKRRILVYFIKVLIS
jgi:hypothetical protein